MAATAYGSTARVACSSIFSFFAGLHLLSCRFPQEDWGLDRGEQLPVRAPLDRGGEASAQEVTGNEKKFEAPAAPN
jgi:hypothetical protein